LDEDVHRIKNRYKLFLSTASKVVTCFLARHQRSWLVS